jgi:hypothetical protein
MVTVAVLFGKALLRNATILHSLLHHPPGKDQLIPPIKISLQQAYGPEFVHKDIPYDLLQQHRKPHPPSRK